MMPYLVLIAAFIIALYFIFRSKKSKQVAENTMNETDRQILLNHVAYYQYLDQNNRVKFEQLLLDFLSYVRVEE